MQVVHQRSITSMTAFQRQGTTLIMDSIQASGLGTNVGPDVYPRPMSGVVVNMGAFVFVGPDTGLIVVEEHGHDRGHRSDSNGCG